MHYSIKIEEKILKNIDEKTKKKIVDLISVILPEAKIYLFGSRARQDFRQSSDIDIALNMGEMIDFGDMLEIKDVLNATNIPQKIDVVDMNLISKEMRTEIETEGILWKE